MSVRNILIVNQPIGNRGDESAHRALVRSLNKALPETKIVVLGFMDDKGAYDEFKVDHPNNEYVKFLFPHNLLAPNFIKFLPKYGLATLGTFLHPVLRKLIPYYKAADVVLCAPGGICMGGFQSWRHLYFLLLAEYFKKPIVYYSRSIGPFPIKTWLNRRFKKISDHLLHTMNFISLRDAQSKGIAERMGMDYVFSIDTAFLQQPRVEVDKAIAEQIDGQPFIVFVPNQLTWHYAYKHVPQERIDQFYLELMKKVRNMYPEHKLVMLPQLCTAGLAGDYSYFKTLAEQSGMDNIVVVSDKYGSDVQQTLIAEASFLIGARYHSVVFAVNNEVPFIALNYEHKIKGLLEDLGLSGNIVDITRVFDDVQTMDAVMRQFDAKLRDEKEVKPSRQKANDIAQNCFKQLCQYLNKL